MSTSDSAVQPPTQADVRPETDRTALRALPRRRFFDDMPDKGMLAFIAIFGFAVIVALKIYNYNSDIVAGIAVGLMLIYGVIAYRIPAVQLRLDRLGDNFYYLGFIFTLASMSAALLQLRYGAQIEALLGSFGIALFTTIVGVAGRVIFAQMRGELDEVEAAVRRDLLGASDHLKGQLNLALRDFETFSTSVRQTAAEIASASSEVVSTQTRRIGETAESAVEQLRRSAEALDAQSQGQIERLAEVAQAAARNIQTAFEDQKSRAEATATATAEAARLLEAVVEQLSSIELPSERLGRQMDAFAAQLERVIARLGDAVDRIPGQPGRRGKRRWYWPFRVRKS
jgi:hypothetical protein